MSLTRTAVHRLRLRLRLRLRHIYYTSTISPSPCTHPKPSQFYLSSSYSSSSKSNLKQGNDDVYPTGEFNFMPHTGFKKFLVKLKTLIALPWERVENSSVLKITLKGKIFDRPKSIFSDSKVSLPQFCDNMLKAVYDPRISAVYLHIDTLNCGWAKLDEIRRQILNFRKSGKFVVAYVTSIGVKEYYVACACEEIYAPPSAYVSLFGFTLQATFYKGIYDNLGIEPQVERIGKYKRAGDTYIRKTMSKEHREMLTALLNNIYSNWLDKVSSARGKKVEDVDNFINEGVYQTKRLEEEGFISKVLYDDEVISRLMERLEVSKFSFVHFRKYSRIRKWTVGISEAKELIAIIRASGSIGSSIIAENFIKKIRKVRLSKKIKAVIIRINSPGGDALASDLIWREIKRLAATKPVIASMSDMAASGGYHMAMGAGVIVAENLTLTGSIGVVSRKFNFEKLYDKIGLNKEVISKGKYSELNDVNQRSFRPHEAELFAKRAQHMYKQFRDNAALSRSMTVDEMEEVAQGRVWTGKDAVSHGLVDAIGGLSRAIAIAKLKAGIPQDKDVTVVELSRTDPTLPNVLRYIGYSLVGAHQTLKELDLTLSDRVQERMDGTMFQNLDGYPFECNHFLRRMFSSWYNN